jgi:hypothetical protein
MEGGRTPGIQRSGRGRYRAPRVQAGCGAQRRGRVSKVQIHKVTKRAVAIVAGVSRTATARGATSRSSATGFLQRERDEETTAEAKTKTTDGREAI